MKRKLLRLTGAEVRLDSGGAAHFGWLVWLGGDVYLCNGVEFALDDVANVDIKHGTITLEAWLEHKLVSAQ